MLSGVVGRFQEADILRIVIGASQRQQKTNGAKPLKSAEWNCMKLSLTAAECVRG